MLSKADVVVIMAMIAAGVALGLCALLFPMMQS